LPKLKKLAVAVGAKIEIHLMVAKPEWQLGDWLRAGADRVIIHEEALEFKDSPIMLGEAVVLGVTPETPVERLIASARYAKQALLLAVKPGFAGGKFDEATLEKVRALRKQLPNVTIEVDGGVNPDTAKKIRAAGADMIVSTSYIRDHHDPKAALESLRSL
jgi:ribulose-phosphate 3-epimerase